jgi:hypothetical protein
MKVKTTPNTTAAPAAPDERGWYRLEGDIDPAALAGLQAVGRIHRLSITHIPLVTVRLAARLAALSSVEWLWLWCPVTRRAMRRVVRLPGLTTLDVLHAIGPGGLADFGKAASLKTFRGNCWMTEDDLLRVCECQTLEALSAHHGKLTRRVLSALLALPRLRALDLEATRFDDAMAARVARSSTITALDVGNTRLTGKGLRPLLDMQQLRSLDLWATRLTEDDVALLRHLPHLEYLSLGNVDGGPSLDPHRVVPLLLELPGLKRVWLDGMTVGKAQRAALQAKLESVRITSGG